MVISDVAASIQAQHGISVREASAKEGETELLRDLQQQLLRAVTSSQSKDAAIAYIASAVAQATDPALMFYLERDPAQGWNQRQLRQGDISPDIPAKLEQQIHAWCDDACRHGNVQINAIDQAQGGIAVTGPILLKGAPPDAFATIYQRNTQPVDCLVVVHQLIAVHIALWQVLGEAKQAEFEAQTTASLMELLASLDAAADLSDACRRLVNELQNHLGCHRVALGLCGRTEHCRLVALSSTDLVDKRSEMARVIEAALDEAVVRDSLTVWPTADDAQRQGGLALEKLRVTTAAGCVISCPLRDDDDQLIGAWLFLGGAEFGQKEHNRHFIEASVRPIGSRIRMLQNAYKGCFARTVHRFFGGSHTARRKLAIGVAVVILAVLCTPLPYTIRCECVLEPVVRRVVVSPYAGMLQKAFVEPGDIVARNDVLARMDEREVQWELAGLEAEYNRAQKERDTALADRDVAAAQRAQLEMKRVSLKRELLQHRGANLEVKSPIDGIVISGDLEKIEGGPLSIGETMFEVAPLDALLVELAIEDREIRHVTEGAKVDIRLEAYPWQKWKGTIANIWPRSEIRDQENVFIAEVKLDNADLQLRPGMKGHAKIIGPRNLLAWNLLHKPCESFLLWTGW